MQAIIILFGVLILFAEAGAEDSPLTLEECYRLALERSEELAVRHEIIKEAEGEFLQAFSGVLPRVSFVSSDTRQESIGGEGVAGSFTRRHIPNRRFKFTQPLFSGFKEFAAMAESRASINQYTYEKARAEQLLLIDVSEAFYYLLEQAEDITTLENIRKTLSERIAELKERERLGRSRSSEVVNVEVQFKKIEAKIKRVNGDEANARHLLEFLTGLEHIETIIEDGYLAPILETENIYEEKVKNRPDVQAAEQAWQAARANVRVARADSLPKVDIEANRYVERTGISKEIDWDMLLTVNVPLFQGKQVAGKVKEAQAQARQAKLRYNETIRRGLLNIKNTYSELAAALEQVEALKQAKESAEQNYKFQEQDYRQNLVSNLDVLQALKELQEVRREFIKANYDAKRLYWRLKVAAGETL